MDEISENNIVSIEEKAASRHQSMRKKAMNGIDTKELNEYYEKIVKESIHHFSFLQKYLAEEFLGDIVIETFAMGLEASKHCLDGKEPEQIEPIYATSLHLTLSDLCSKHQMYQFFQEWDAYSLTIMAEDLSGKWFRKGVHYGQKQRKLRLM